MFLPLKTDRPQRATPVVNYTIIGLCVLVYLITPGIRQASSTEPWRQVAQFFLWPEAATLSQFITYQFLHADWLHLTGNMVFLYVFGNAVEDRLGKVAYLFFYLAGGVIAGVGHAMLETSPVLGASGSVAAVTGAYLALFPQSVITILYVLVIIGTFEVTGMSLILFRVVQDLIFQLYGIGNVAYMAHLAGYAYGFAVGMGLLLAGLLKREPYDMLALIERRRRRSDMKKLARQGFEPWEGRGGVSGKISSETPMSEQQQRVAAVRLRISEAMGRGALPEAATLYTDLLTIDPKQSLGSDAQLDIANQLMSDQRHDAAARAYEIFLATYPSYHDRGQVMLVLALLYTRYLDQPARGRELLESALPRLRGEDKALAERVLGEHQQG